MEYSSLPKSESVKVGDKTYEIKELSLRKTGTFLAKLAAFTVDDGKSFDVKMADAITFATGIPEDEFLDLPGSAAVELLSVAIHVNSIAETLKKKLSAMFSGTEPTT